VNPSFGNQLYAEDLTEAETILADEIRECVVWFRGYVVPTSSPTYGPRSASLSGSGNTLTASTGGTAITPGPDANDSIYFKVCNPNDFPIELIWNGSVSGAGFVFIMSPFGGESGTGSVSLFRAININPLDAISMFVLVGGYGSFTASMTFRSFSPITFISIGGVNYMDGLYVNSLPCE
jgi:hypothetical protein